MWKIRDLRRFIQGTSILVITPNAPRNKDLKMWGIERITEFNNGTSIATTDSTVLINILESSTFLNFQNEEHTTLFEKEFITKEFETLYHTHFSEYRIDDTTIRISHGQFIKFLPKLFNKEDQLKIQRIYFEVL